MAKQVVSFHYRLTDSKGKEVDSSLGAEPLAFLEGSGQIIPGLEGGLGGVNGGEKKKINFSY